MHTPQRRSPGAVLARLPGWSAALISVACIVVGALLTLRPFASLGTMIVLLVVGMFLAGARELLDDDAPTFARITAAALWVAAGVLVLVVPGLTIALLTFLVAGMLIVSGAARVVRALRGTHGRAAGAMQGAAGIIIGALGLLWPDVTVLVIGVAFGIWLVVFGITGLLGLRRRRTPRPVDREPRPRPLLAGAALLGSVLLVALSALLTGAPRPDAFYAAPAEVPDEPGQLLRAEPFTTDVPAGATGWRILYTTTRAADEPAVASAIVVRPDAGGDFPVVSWAHGTTGVAEGCAPSLLDHPFTAGGMPDIRHVLRNGWALVATDYVGLGTEGPHPYLIGDDASRAVLDATRAARQLDDTRLAGPTVIWGHSQGGHSALWAGGLQAAYAPELDVAGVAAVAPAAPLSELLGTFGDSPVGSLFGAYVIHAYAEHYDDITPRDYIRPGARIMVSETVTRCLSHPDMVVSLATALSSDKPAWEGNPDRGPLAERVAENIPRLPIAAPLLLAQGGADTLVTPEAQGTYVDELCERGQQVDYRVYPGRDHMGVVADGSPLIADLVVWTAARFAGEPVPDGCLR